MLFLLFLASLVAGDFPFRNTSLPWADRVNDLVGRLTLDEIKLQISRGGSGPKAGPAPAVPRLGITPYSWNTECLRGDAGAGHATAFPQAIGLGASFSTDLIFRVAQATGVEVRAKFNDYMRKGQYGDHKGISCFSPVINIVRDPRWGRNQETYGEDPFLTGVFAANFVKGLQGSDPRYIRANAGCKHFNVHGGPENIPVSRFSFDAKVSERDWRTTFLPAFRSCVKAGTYNVMCSFNKINGVPACVNKKLLTDILRNEWGFKGYVISDQAAIENIISEHHYINNSVDTVTACVKAGLNLELSTNLHQPVYFSVVDAVKQGKLTEDEVRANVKTLFNVRMRLGEFDPPEMNPYSKLNLSVLQSEAHRNLSVEATLKSFVLLKNDNVLPLKASNYKNVAIVGPMANNTIQLFGNYAPDMNPNYTTNPLQGITTLWSAVRYGAGCTDNKCTQYNSEEVLTAAKGAGLIFVCLGTGQELESEGNDKANLDLPGQQLQLLKDAVTAGQGGAKVILLLFNAGPLNITWAVESPNVQVIMELFFPSQATGEALRRVLLADGPNSVPAGRLPITWPKYINTVPDMTDYSMAGRTYRYAKYQVLFPFGYGLSYTKFVYDSMRYLNQVKAGDDITGSVTLSNRGSFDADEVIQVYISWSNPTVTVPHLQLVAFNRVFAPRGVQTQWNFTISAESLAVWTDQKGWVVEPGVVVFWVGGQQPNIKPDVGSNVLSGKVEILGQKRLGRY
ncbi:probable beta-D-xylosidase 2 isoform X2 [Haliotis rufescens]|uniref:probable beta-D-xylosidase 2 isoform X2 n=1 Tax=Haliotis rufescens TaxID=6454 RepID=UPI00201EE4C2|nr:probable beta-D-xylosidase 2 isoform X2 [Haliotis rufescens]